MFFYENGAALKNPKDAYICSKPDSPESAIDRRFAGQKGIENMRSGPTGYGRHQISAKCG